MLHSNVSDNGSISSTHSYSMAVPGVPILEQAYGSTVSQSSVQSTGLYIYIIYFYVLLL